MSCSNSDYYKLVQNLMVDSQPRNPLILLEARVDSDWREVAFHLKVAQARSKGRRSHCKIEPGLPATWQPVFQGLCLDGYKFKAAGRMVKITLADRCTCQYLDSDFFPRGKKYIAFIQKESLTDYRHKIWRTIDALGSQTNNLSRATARCTDFTKITTWREWTERGQ